MKNLESLEELNEKRRLQRQAHEQEKNPSTTSIEVNDEEVCKIPELPIVVKGTLPPKILMHGMKRMLVVP